MDCVKQPGQRLMARDFDRQVAEVQVRVAVLNGFTALGVPVTKVVGQVCPAKGTARPSDDLRDRACFMANNPVAPGAALCGCAG
jgi:hypothetical protein